MAEYAVFFINFLRKWTCSENQIYTVPRISVYHFGEAVCVCVCVCWSELKRTDSLPVGESNPGLPRDRRGYSPLY